MNASQYTYSENTIDSFAEAILDRLSQIDNSRGVVVTLSGDLGAGKTTFTQALGKKLGIADHISSPTFVIMKRYETTHNTWKTLIHIDAYRLTSWQELKDLDIGQWLEKPDTLIIIEWPEKVSDMDQLPHLQISLRIESNNNERVAEVQ